MLSPEEAPRTLHRAKGEVGCSSSQEAVHVLLLVTGSVAAVKLGLLLDEIAEKIPQCECRIACTTPAMHFIRRAQPSGRAIPFSQILTDRDEWSRWETVKDEVLHIELRRWADCVLIAPVDANSLAKIANGMCDNLVTCVMRAWEVGKKPVILCPAMNTLMWQHPSTAEHLRKFLELYSGRHNQSRTHINILDKMGDKDSKAERGVCNSQSEKEFDKAFAAAFSADSSLETAGGASETVDIVSSPSHPVALAAAMAQVVWPVKKRLACGDIGMGGMASVQTITNVLRHTVGLMQQERKQGVEPSKMIANVNNGVEKTVSSHL